MLKRGDMRTGCLIISGFTLRSHGHAYNEAIDVERELLYNVTFPAVLHRPHTYTAAEPPNEQCGGHQNGSDYETGAVGNQASQDRRHDVRLFFVSWALPQHRSLDN